MNTPLKSYTIHRRAPENYREGDLDACIQEFEYLTYNVELLELKFCLVSVHGSVYNYGFLLFKKSLIGPKHYHEFSLRRRLRDIYRLNKVVLPKKEKYLLSFDAWGIGHYHWISEVLTRLELIRENLHEYILLLPDEVYIRKVGTELMHILGYNPKSIIYIKKNELIFVYKLYFVSHLALTGRINDKVMKLFKCSIDEILKPRYNAIPAKKIYVTRKKAKMRKVLNENDVCEFLIKKGYEIVCFEELTIEQQIKICCESNTMVSIHGAGLSNMIFMPKGSIVVEFRRKDIFINQCYWHLADSIRHKYYYFFGEPDSDKPIEGEGCNLFINIESFKAFIHSIDGK